MKRNAKTAASKGGPTTVNGTLPPPRRSNAQLRPREFLTGQEVELLRKRRLTIAAFRRRQQ
jgi:hypothetical protein